MMRLFPRLVPAVASLFLVAVARDGSAQPADTVHLGALQRSAIAGDPRNAQTSLFRRQTDLRRESLRSERLPSFFAGSTAQHQSDITSVNFPGVKAPSKDTYDANVGLRVRLLDPSRSYRGALEDAQLRDAEARIVSTTFAQRQAVNDAFFAVRSIDAQRQATAAGIADLETHLRLARQRVQEGVSLPSEEALIEVELLRRRQALTDLASQRQAALSLLADLTGQRIAENAVLAAPGLDAMDLPPESSTPTRRPEYQSFAAGRDLLDARANALTAQERPRLSAFGRTGYGRPGLNMLSRNFDTYWLAGIQLEWSPFDWGTAQRDREVLSLQRDVIASDEQAFTDRLRRATITDRAAIGRLAQSLRTDDAIVALRERILRETQVRHQEGVVTVAELIDRDTDLQAARLTREAHRIELEQTRARLLTTLGIDLP